jgi:hypothetical protein
MADLPVPQIAISGANTLAATNMTKSSTTVYTYAYSVGAGNGTATVVLSTGKDLAGNVVTSTPTSGATFTVDNTGPSISIGLPSVSSTNSGGPVTYTITYADPHFNTSTLSLSNITLNRTGDANGSVSLSGSGLNYTVTINSITGNNGSLGISIAANTASDTLGNLAPGGTSTTFTVDKILPSVSWSAPPPCGNVNCYFNVINQTIQLAVNASDNVGIYKVVFRRWDFKANPNQWVDIGTVYSSPYSINFNTSVLYPGTNQIDAWAYDGAGNMYRATSNVTNNRYYWFNHTNTWKSYLPIIRK